MLFIRNYLGWSGGHLKVHHYYQHVLQSKRFLPEIHFTAQSTSGADNPWRSGPPARIAAEPHSADACFLAGFDWRVIDALGVDLRGKPVVNLLQDFFHVQPGNDCWDFLTRPAIRICISPALADAVRATGRANGPVILIEAGLPAPAPGGAPPHRPVDVFVGAMKNPPMGQQIAAALERAGATVDLAASYVARSEYLDRLAAAKVAVLLPRAREGFFLPPLEAMQRGVCVVTADCLGNRAFCRHEVTCLLPAYDAPAMAAAAATLLRDENLRHRLQDAGRAESATRSIERERAEFLALLDDGDLHGAPP